MAEDKGHERRQQKEGASTPIANAGAVVATAGPLCRSMSHTMPSRALTRGGRDTVE